MSLSAAEPDRRDRLYARLGWRNRVVGLLRWVVPSLGLALLVFLVVEIAIDNLRNQFGFANIRIDRDNLVVDTPQLTATGDDGTGYALEARAAKTSLSSTEMVQLTDAVFSMKPLQGAALRARAALADLDTSSQQVSVTDVTQVESDDGMHGTMVGVFADLVNWTMVAHGAVDLAFPDGSRLIAADMDYDGKTRMWKFNRVTVTLAATPGESR